MGEDGTAMTPPTNHPAIFLFFYSARSIPPPLPPPTRKGGKRVVGEAVAPVAQLPRGMQVEDVMRRPSRGCAPRLL